MPRFRDCLIMINARLAGSAACIALVALHSLVAGAAETPPGFDYPTNLREVYGAYQAVLARRDTCITAHPQSRAGAEKAFVAWQTRHRKLIEELDQRVTMMIRGASKDEKEYARNVGMIWLAFGVLGVIFRTVQLFFVKDVQAGLVWVTKILTDPFHDIKLYYKAPLHVLRGELIDPAAERAH